MPSKKKRYDTRFPPARIKKIMQADEEVGKVAAVVPVLISRTVELFVESLLTKTVAVTKARNARTLTPAHLKATIFGDDSFAFLRDTVSSVPDIQPGAGGDNGDESLEAPMPAATTKSSSSAGRRPRAALAIEPRTTTVTPASVGQKKRGRPKKTAPVEEEEDEEDVLEEEEELSENNTEEDEEPQSSSNNALSRQPMVPFPNSNNNFSSNFSNNVQQIDEDYDA